MRKSVLCLVLLVGVYMPVHASARPWCVPPAFDQGRRLHPLPNPDVFWLELMLRQHELCWRRPATADELRVLLFGSSAVYGFPLPVEETLSTYMNQRLAAAHPPAHLFNLAFVTPNQVRDALLIHEALPYDPDVIVYPLTLAEFRHIAPMWFPTSTRFFEMNDAALRRLAADPPAGLEQPVEQYATANVNNAVRQRPAAQLRDAGLYARRLAEATAETFAAAVNSPRPRHQAKAGQRQTEYDCSETERAMISFKNWKEWNVLAYLEDLQKRRGIRVLVVHWPIAHEPLGNCYSVRYTNTAVQDFADWIAAQTRQRQLPYLDLSTFLPAESFIDSLHIKPEGHQLLADHIVKALTPILSDAAAQPAQAQGAGR
jgi:hypothetical protein